MSEEVDFEALRATGRVKLAAFIGAIAGFWTLLLANQSLNIIRFEGIWALIILTKFALSVGLFFFAFQTFKMRTLGVWGSVAVGGLTFLLGSGWLIFSFANSLISFMPLMVVPSAFASAILTFLGRGDIARAETARESMQDSGMDLGV
jgi:hypothetical protein